MRRPLMMMRGRGLTGHVLSRHHGVSRRGMPLSMSIGPFIVEQAEPTPLKDENLLLNSRLEGISGTYVQNGIDSFVAPHDWRRRFASPKRVTAIEDIDAAADDDAMRAVCELAQAWLRQTIDLSAHIGEKINVSVNVDDTQFPNVEPVIMAKNNVTLIDDTNNTGDVHGRRWSVYEVTGTGIVEIRFGVGIAGDAAHDCILSRPQVSIGAQLQAYKQT